MECSFETLKLEDPAEHVLRVVLNRPERRNAFNTQMAQDLVDCFEALAMAPQSYRAVILTGAGDKAFCAGGDLKERLGMSDAAWFSQHLVYERMARALLACPLPVIAAVNGAAFGGGCELVAACDFAYAVPDAKFAQTEVKIGIIPGAGGTQTLTRAVGERRAKELILSGRVFTGQDACEWGLVNAVFDFKTLQDAALETARAIAANAPVATRQAKQAISRGRPLGMAEGLAMEIECYNRTVPTRDRREGVAAFNEKRAPDFDGS